MERMKIEMKNKGRKRNTGHEHGLVSLSHPCLDYREATVGRGSGAWDLRSLGRE
jgi:hypothetical protein